MKQMYDALLEDGELFMVIEGATGVWKEDRQKFKEYFEMLKKIDVTNFENLN